MGEASNEDLTAEQVRALREDIDQTREQIGDTLEAIGEKLSPGNMVQEAAQTVRDAASRTVENVMTTASERVSDLAEQGRDTVEAVRRRVGDNAVPAAVAAVFLGWVAYKALRRNGSSVRPTTRGGGTCPSLEATTGIGRAAATIAQTTATGHETPRSRSVPA